MSSEPQLSRFRRTVIGFVIGSAIPFALLIVGMIQTLIYHSSSPRSANIAYCATPLPIVIFLLGLICGIFVGALGFISVNEFNKPESSISTPRPEMKN